MSTPAFAPGITSSLPTHLNHHPSNHLRAAADGHSVSSASAASSSSTASSIRSASSSSLSSSSTPSPAASSNTSSGGSLAMSALMMASPSETGKSGINGSHQQQSEQQQQNEGVMMDEDDGDAGSHRERRLRSGSESGTRELAGLSMQENGGGQRSPLHIDTTGESTETSSGGPQGSKTRRASTLSSSSSSASNLPFGGSSSADSSSTAGQSSGWWTSGKGEREGHPARRKAPRMGSFEVQQQDSVAGEASTSSAQMPPPPSSTSSSSRRGSTASRSSEKRADAPSTQVPTNSRPPIPGSAFPAQSTGAPDTTSNQADQRPQHVEIVSYPSPDLLRLLASLLEQIAHANDSLHQRTSQASRSGSTSPADSREYGAYGTETQQAFSQGRFDAAPLNSPATPRYRRGSMQDETVEQVINRENDGMTTTEAAGSSSTSAAPATTEMPVTPGVDLLREVGASGGVEGFMPSLGGNHAPQPLNRRRGSSFLRNRDDAAALAAANEARRGSSHGSFVQERNDPGPAAATVVLPASGTRTQAQSGTAGTTTPPSQDELVAESDQASGSSNVPPPASAVAADSPPIASLLTASSQALSSPSATLCFHARNVPAITIEAYLLRILKYCPTTNEVFLSLLVYFDRMARIGLEAQKGGSVHSRPGTSRSAGGTVGGTRQQDGAEARPFAIDSFNVHRLVIAGVTVASKFFSDVFYTNSRYAKVGGLPLNELNQLELQFLLLNDFNLVVSVDELQRYADQLILHWIGRNGGPSSQTGGATSANTNVRGQSTATPTAASGLHRSQSMATSSSASVTPRPPVDGSASATPRPGGGASWNTTPHRPRSLRSQESSGTSSVTSTVTPGTPSTPRKSDNEDDDQGDHDDEEGQEATHRRRDSDTPHAMDED